MRTPVWITTELRQLAENLEKAHITRTMAAATLRQMLATIAVEDQKDRERQEREND